MGRVGLDKKGFTDLTESSKSSASIAQNNKQWVGTCLYQEWLAPLLITAKQHSVMSK